MKKLTLLLFFIGGLVSSQAQESMSNDSMNETHRTLILKLGVNLVDNSGYNNPFEALSGFDQMAFSNNYNVELEYRFSKWFSLAAALSNNKWKANKGMIDGIIITSDVKYLALDLDLKYYYDETFGGWFDRNDWIELYLHGGVGTALQGNHAGVTLNFGPGANFWISEQFGINLNGTGKWSLNNGDHLYNTSHFQYSASLMYRFIDNDDDNDGVKNKVDDCPNVPGVAENNGCPEESNDRDGDGVVNALDKCPDVYAANNGCPQAQVEAEADTDGDGVFDSADNCPKTKGLPTNNGCPLPDSDNDGIVDSADKCPTVPGIESNNGCPYKEVMVGAKDTELNKLTPDILFNTSSYKIKDESLSVLQTMAKIMKQHPEAVFKFSGYTDSSGPSEFNKRLSKNRVTAVRDYFVNNLGISPNNIMTEHFGEANPIASNSTRDGRRKNRRVEVVRIK